MLGHVEIIQTYDGDYYYVFIDGKPANIDNSDSHQIYKEDWVKVILKNKNQKSFANSATLKVEDLKYSFYNIYHTLIKKIGDEYYSDDYEEYSSIESAIKKYNINPDFYKQSIDYIENNF